MSAPQVALFGRMCRTTARALEALSQSGIEVKALVTSGSLPGARVVRSPTSSRTIPLIEVESAPALLPNVATLSWSMGTTHIETSRRELATLADRFPALQDTQFVSSCFPWKLPVRLLQRSVGVPLNVHPSLLPRHRGADPLFWTFHAGDQQAGATVHVLTNEYDAGPIIAQKTVSLHTPPRYGQLQEQLDRLGASLLVEALRLPVANEIGQIDQTEADATRAPLPTPEDYLVEQNWSADRAFRFVRGIGQEFGPATLSIDNRGVALLVEALARYPLIEETPAIVLSLETADVRFSDGVVRFRTTPD